MLNWNYYKLVSHLHYCMWSMYSCELFGNKIPNDLESTYYSLIKCCLGVGANTPYKLVLIESDMPTLQQSLIYSRQFNFFTNFVAQLKENSPRKAVFDIIQQSNNDFVNHSWENQSKMDINNLYHDKFQLYRHWS